MGVTPVNTMLLMLSVPLLEGAAFWILLRNPCCIPKKDSQVDLKRTPTDEESALDEKELNMSVGDKIRYIPSLLKYMVPLGLVYFFEYFINQGLVSLFNEFSFNLLSIYHPKWSY